jgi:hypothetical protein
MNFQLPDGENVFRSAVFPIAFRKKKLSPKAFLKLWPSADDIFTLEMSMAWQRYVPTNNMVHAFGCRLAASLNASEIAADRTANRVYCGSYKFSSDEIRSLSDLNGLQAIRSSMVVHEIENHEIAHANCRIQIDTNGDEDLAEPVKTAIVDRLWHICVGPSRYICPINKGISDHPSAFLGDAPRGPYVDDRSFLQTFADIISYWAYYAPRARRQDI